MNNLVDIRGDDFVEVLPNWKETFEAAFELNVQMFHKSIWDMSLTAFDKPREVQVVIDGNDNLFISVGTPGFVSFGGQNEQTHGMKFPLKEWIHTHPFGRAYFSSTDLTTVSMYERFLNSATVLGDGEKSHLYFRVDGSIHYQEFSQFTWVDVEQITEEEE